MADDRLDRAHREAILTDAAADAERLDAIITPITSSTSSWEEDTPEAEEDEFSAQDAQIEALRERFEREERRCQLDAKFARRYRARQRAVIRRRKIITGCAVLPVDLQKAAKSDGLRRVRQEERHDARPLMLVLPRARGASRERRPGATRRTASSSRSGGADPGAESGDEPPPALRPARYQFACIPAEAR